MRYFTTKAKCKLVSRYLVLQLKYYAVIRKYNAEEFN